MCRLLTNHLPDLMEHETLTMYRHNTQL